MNNLFIAALMVIADAPDVPRDELSANTGQFLNFLFYIVMFAFVIGLLFLVLKLLKRQAGFFTRGNYFTLIDSIVLSKETSVHLVEIGGKIMVVGTGKEVSLLTVLDDPEIINEITRERVKESRENKIAGNVKNKLIERLPLLNNLNIVKDKNQVNAEDIEINHEETSEFEKELKEQLKKLKQLDKKRQGGNKDEDEE